MAIETAYNHDRYTIRRKVLKIFGGAFHIYDPQGGVAFYSKLKAFKLKEDLRIYTGEDMQTEALVIKARKVLDISSAYDVVDAQSGVKIGALQRRGFKSMIRDEWMILGADDQELGMIQEDSPMLALIRRFVDLATLFLPQKYSATVGGEQVAALRQHANPFVFRVEVDFSMDSEGLLDRRLGIAAALLLAAIEGRQG